MERMGMSPVVIEQNLEHNLYMLPVHHQAKTETNVR